MYKIQANHSGTRSIAVEESHLATIARYHLLDHLVDSNGIVDENVLDKLKFNIRSLLSGDAGADRSLLDLCLDVIYNSDMKAFGLENLLRLYREWEAQQPESPEASETSTQTDD